MAAFFQRRDRNRNYRAGLRQRQVIFFIRLIKTMRPDARVCWLSQAIQLSSKLGFNDFLGFFEL